jgi:hypothetical protein
MYYGVIVGDKLTEMREETDLKVFKLLSQNLFEDLKKTTKKFRYLVTEAIFLDKNVCENSITNV